MELRELTIIQHGPDLLFSSSICSYFCAKMLSAPLFCCSTSLSRRKEATSTGVSTACFNSVIRHRTSLMKGESTLITLVWDRAHRAGFMITNTPDKRRHKNKQGGMLVFSWHVKRNAETPQKAGRNVKKRRLCGAGPVQSVVLTLAQELNSLNTRPHFRHRAQRVFRHVHRQRRLFLESLSNPRGAPPPPASMMPRSTNQRKAPEGSAPTWCALRQYGIERAPACFAHFRLVMVMVFGQARHHVRGP